MGNNEAITQATPKEVKTIIEKKLADHDEPLYVFYGWCKKCGICIGFCPHKALEWNADGYPSVINDRCKRCNMCEHRCPEFAITILEGR